MGKNKVLKEHLKEIGEGKVLLLIDKVFKTKGLTIIRMNTYLYSYFYSSIFNGKITYKGINKECINSNIIWVDTKEGHNFWNDVYQQLGDYNSKFLEKFPGTDQKDYWLNFFGINNEIKMIAL